MNELLPITFGFGPIAHNHFSQVFVARHCYCFCCCCFNCCYKIFNNVVVIFVSIVVVVVGVVIIVVDVDNVILFATVVQMVVFTSDHPTFFAVYSRSDVSWVH